MTRPYREQLAGFFTAWGFGWAWGEYSAADPFPYVAVFSACYAFLLGVTFQGLLRWWSPADDRDAECDRRLKEWEG